MAPKPDRFAQRRDLPYFVTCRRPDSWRESHRRRAAVARILAGSGYVRLRSSCLPPALFPFRPSRGGGAGNVAVSPCRPCPEPPRHAFPHPRSPRAGVLPEQEPRRFRIARARALSTTSQRAVGGGMCLAVGAAGAAAYGMGVALCAEQPDELVDMSQLQQWDSNWDGRCPPTRVRARHGQWDLCRGLPTTLKIRPNRPISGLGFTLTASPCGGVCQGESELSK